MEYALVGALIIFLVYLFIETKRKSQRIMQAVIEEKKNIAEDSGMTASIGVFSPDLQTTVVIGASEEKGVFYYRMLRQARVINKSRINLANLAHIDFLINGTPHEISATSELATLTLRATEIAETTVSRFTPDTIKTIQRTVLRVIFYDDSGAEKTLDITTFRHTDEKQKFERVQLLKTTVWWVAFLQLASRKARQIRASLEPDEVK